VTNSYLKTETGGGSEPLQRAGKPPRLSRNIA
jgi:hypothetical protein